MALIDAIPMNGEAPSAAPEPSTSSASGGLADLIPSQKKQSDQGMGASLPASPVTNNPDQFFANRAGATEWAPSPKKDTSGLPYLSFKPKQVSTPPVVEKQSTKPNFNDLNLKPGSASPELSPEANGFITDYTRVDTTFDPRVAKPITTGSFTTPRAVANRAALKDAMGGSYSSELDHVIALELGGSNNKANLQIEPDVPGTQNTATDPLENQLAQEVISGKKSLFQAQWDLAKAKGKPLPYLGDSVNTYENQAYDAQKASEYANSPLGITENALGTIKQAAAKMVAPLMQKYTGANPFQGPGPANAPRTQGPFGVPSVVTTSLDTAGKAAVAVAKHPVLFSAGFTDELVQALAGVRQISGEISAATGKPVTSPNAFAEIHANDLKTLENDPNAQSPDAQAAVAAGRFAAWMVPYGTIAKAAEATVGAAGLAELAPKLAPLLPYISDAAGFLGTGQVLHDPANGTRVDQVRNDAIALSLFWTGGLALTAGLPAIAAGLRKVLPPAAENDLSKVMQPVVEKLKNGEPVSATELEAATSRGNAIIKDATDKDPKSLLQDQLGLKAPDTSEFPAPDTKPNTKYLFHGTNQTLVDSIKSTGLKPMGRGALSLSNDEGYARSFAENSQFPPKKGGGVLLRVKADALNGKTITPDGPRPEPDVLHEILTKETIPSESIEIFKDGHWQPLKSTAGEHPEMHAPDVVEARAKAAEIPETHTISTDERTQLRNKVSDELYDKRLGAKAAEDKAAEVRAAAKADPNNAELSKEADAAEKEAQKLRQEANDINGPGAKNKNRRADIVIGLPAAGKSSNVANVLAEHHGSLIVDSDMAKEKLPEFNKGLGANATHKESDIIATGLRQRATNAGDNMVLPLVGKNTAKIKDIIDELHSNGYSVQLHFNDLENVKAQGRAITRFRETGRFVDPQYVHSLGLTPKETYDTLKQYERVAGRSQISSDVPRGARPILGEEFQSGLPLRHFDTGKAAAGSEAGHGNGAGPVRPEIKLPELPETGLTLHGAAFPGANAISKFIEKDIIDRIGSAREAIKGIYSATKNLFSYNATRETAAAITGAAIEKTEQFASSAWKVASKRRDWWAGMPADTHLDFIDAMETGLKDPGVFDRYGEEYSQTMRDLAAEYRDRLDRAFKTEADAGLDKNYIEEYFPHMWTDSEKAQRFFQEYFFNSFGANYREAFGSYQQARTIDLIRTGLDHGLSLVTTNPEELVLMREIDGFRATARNDIMRELQTAGLAVKTKGMFDTAGKGMPVVRGADGAWWAVTPDAKQILDRAFFSPSLWSEQSIRGGLFRSFMAVKGTVVPLQLSLSGFHPFHVQTIATASSMADAFGEMLNGRMSAAEGLKEMAKGISMAHTGADLFKYWKVGHWWDTPLDQLSGEAKTTVQWLIDAGGSPKISEEFKIRAGDGFKGALKDENYIGAAIRGVPKVVEAMQKPIFEYYVPALKVAGFMRTAENAVRANPELATNDIARKVAFRKIWKDMDSRFGEMVYKTKFWNPMLTQVGEASFLSLGWQVGFVDQFMGGALDLGKLAVQIGKGQATRADVTSRMVFSLVYTMQAAMWGGLMTYAMTGKVPQSIQDLFYPNTGEANPDGSEARLNTPFYTREFFGFLNHIKKEGPLKGPIGMVENKANPILTSLSDIYNNKDYYGYDIRDSNDSLPQQAAQLFKYVVENNGIPISAKGASQALPVTGPLGAAASFAGFNPAPKYIAETPIQTKIYSTLDKRSGGAKPLDSKPIADAKQNIRQLYYQGKYDQANQALSDAIDKGYIKEAGAGTFVADLDLPGDVRAFKSLAQYPSDQEALLAQMSEQDLARYAQYASKDILAHLSTLSPAAKQFVADFKSGKVQWVKFKAGQPVKNQ